MKSENGRSMVEMLGVLAIIGVLSVGAISGYSKAMFKYKLNKQAESFSMLLNEAIMLLPDLERHYGKNVTTRNNLNDFFYKANLLPDGMTYNAADNRIYDIFKNKILLHYTMSTHGDGSTSTDYYMAIETNHAGGTISGQNNEICRNIFLVAKENAQNILSIEMRSTRTDGYSTVILRGGRHPTSNSLSKASIKQINDTCSSCNAEKGCEIFLVINESPNP